MIRKGGTSTNTSTVTYWEELYVLEFVFPFGEEAKKNVNYLR